MTKNEPTKKDPKPCNYCRKFFAKYSCARTRYGECDCPKCQGYCECREEDHD